MLMQCKDISSSRGGLSVERLVHKKCHLVAVDRILLGVTLISSYSRCVLYVDIMALIGACVCIEI